MEAELRTLYLIAFAGVVAGISLRASTAFSVMSTIKYIAMLTLSFSLGRAIISFFAPRAVERKGSSVAAFGFLSLSILSVAYLVVPGNWYWLLRFPHGMASGISWPAMQALVMGKAKPENRAKVSSTYFLVGTVSTAVGYVLSGFKFIKPILLSTILFLIISIYLFKHKVEFEKWGKQSKGKILNISSLSIFLSSFSLGLLMALINTEITLAVLYKLVGRTATAILMALASFGGALLGYFMGRRLLDVNQSLYSLALPGYLTLLSSSGLLSGNPAVVTGSTMLAQAGMTWWRSANMALARSHKGTGLRLGLDNAGRNLGTTLSSLLLSLGLSIADVIAISFVTFTLALSEAGFSSFISRWRIHHRLKRFIKLSSMECLGS